MNQNDKYRKFLLNRMSTNQEITDYIENSLISEDELTKHSFHKILVCNWPNGDLHLYETLSQYCGVTFVPVNFTESNLLTSFYTNSLMLVMKILKLDFMFPYCRNMFSLDILLNDKTTTDCFEEKITIDEIVTHVVSHRFNEFCELNLSDFCNDPEFKKRNIHFYKLSLLSHFKILMIRMGRDTKVLNLSYNNLSHVPLDILNFFIKGDLIGVNLSNNNIPSVLELHRISSRIEKLWVEENPLCKGLDAITYIRQVALKFPRLTELDGVSLNHYGIKMPFHRNYLVTSNRKTIMIVEKFVSLYFSHYDTARRKIDMFYAPQANMTLTTDFQESPEELGQEPYAMHSRNFLDPLKRAMAANNKKLYKKKDAVVAVLAQLPATTHDLSTFKIDVPKHDINCLIMIIDGVYKEKETRHHPERCVQFRRTFIFDFVYRKNYSIMSYNIVNEMFSVRLASRELIENSFKTPIRNLNQLTLIDPDSEDRKTMCSIMIHYTQLKKSEAEARLKRHQWDIREALKEFRKDYESNKINSDRFMEDDFSDVSSILDDEID